MGSEERGAATTARELWLNCIAACEHSSALSFTLSNSYFPIGAYLRALSRTQRALSLSLSLCRQKLLLHFCLCVCVCVCFVTVAALGIFIATTTTTATTAAAAAATTTTTATVIGCESRAMALLVLVGASPFCLRCAGSTHLASGAAKLRYAHNIHLHIACLYMCVCLSIYTLCLYILFM